MINFWSFESEYKKYKKDILKIIDKSLSSGITFFGNNLNNFERNFIRKYKTKFGISVGSGTDALMISLMAIGVKKGDEVITAANTAIPTIAAIINSGATPVLADVNLNDYLIDINSVKKLITKKTKAILICNPNNPTGYLYSKNEIKKLVEIVKKHDLFLIADEVYREFTYDGESHYSIMQESTIDQNAIMIDSVSKRYSMCGARIGCVVSKNKKVIETVLKFAQSRLSPPTYAQIASEAALDTPEIYFEEINKKYIQRRNLLISELRKIKGLKVASPKGAFYCIVELPIKDANEFAQWMLEKFNVNNETIMVAPAEGFYSTKGLGKNQIRIAYVLKEEDLKKSVTILKKALDKYIN